MKCPICGGKEKLFGKTKEFEIYKCKNCGFGWTQGAALQKGDYHRDDDYIKEESLFINIFQKRANLILNLSKPGKVLEVGCSTGILLSLLQAKGWDVTGVEISKPAAEIAKNRGIKVYEQKFEKIKFTEKYDCIIFNHTLEHLENPVQILEKTKSLLKPKGLLYIDLPNFDSLTAMIFRKKWTLLLPQEHLWHFTSKSFKLLMNKLDFKILLIERASGIWDYQRPIRGTLKSLVKFKKRFFRESFTAMPSLVLTKIGKGSDLMVIARKK